MYSLNTLILVVIVTALAAGSVVWLTQTIGQLRAQVTEQARQLEALRLEQAKPMPETVNRWADNLRLDHRAQLLSVAELVKLSARDNLDALMRLSPDMVQRLLREEFPHLFDKEGIQ